jgi:hypothetical protein
MPRLLATISAASQKRPLLQASSQIAAQASLPGLAIPFSDTVADSDQRIDSAPNRLTFTARSSSGDEDVAIALNLY